MNDLTDAELVVRLQAQDARAFEILFGRYFEALVRFAFYRLGSRDAAKDVVQDIFVHIWEHPESFIPLRSLKQYLYSAVRHHALDVWKHDAVRARHYEATLASIEANPSSVMAPSAESVILDKATIDVAMSRLSPRRQEAVRLRFEEQLTHAEIGQVLGISKDAAERLVHRALDDLQKILNVLA
jgi:RNA polymerase sigma-70 factor (ECF subfamily)